jgi:hypothetical protein
VCVKFSKRDHRYAGTVKLRARSGALQGELGAAPAAGLGSLPHGEFFVFAQFLHVQITMLLEPVLVSLDGQGADQAQAALRVGKDPHHLGAAFNFFGLTPSRYRKSWLESAGKEGRHETGTV